MSTTKKTVKKSGEKARQATKSRDMPSEDERVKWKTAWKPSMVSRLSDSDLAVGKQAFFNMDRDSSGTIDEDELLQALRGLGHSLKREEVKELIKEAEGEGGDSDGKINIRKFLGWYSKCLLFKPDTDKQQVRMAQAALAVMSWSPILKMPLP